MRCECPDRSVEAPVHELGDCRREGTVRVVRGVYPDSKIMHVCVDCTTTGDRRLDPEED